MHESSDGCKIGLVDQTEGLQSVCTAMFCAYWEEAVVIEVNIAMGLWDVHDGHIEDTDQQIEGGNQVREDRKQLALGSYKQQPGCVERASLVGCPLPSDGQIKVAAEEILQQYSSVTSLN